MKKSIDKACFDDAALLRLRSVLRILPISASSWWEGVRSGKYPAPIKLGPRTTCWRASDVLQLINHMDESHRSSKE